MGIRIGLFLSLVLNLILFLALVSSGSTKIEHVAKQKPIMIDSKSDSKIAVSNVDGPQLKKEAATQAHPLSADEEMNLRIDQYFKSEKEFGRGPTEVALDWGKKLPIPKTKAEYALKHILLEYYDSFYRPVEPGYYRGKIYIDLPRYFEHLDQGYTDYLAECLDKMDIKTEQKMRTQLYVIAAQSRQTFPFFKNLKEDFEFQSRYVEENSENYDWSLVVENEKAERYLKTDQKQRYLDHQAENPVFLSVSDTVEEQ
jgi:hypothetical protein